MNDFFSSSSGRNPPAELERRLPQALVRAMERALNVGLVAARRAMGGSGPDIRSGRLANSLGKRVRVEGNTVIGELFARAPYAAAQEKGALIQAKRAKYLKFRVQGKWVQKKRVIIPARPYLRPAIDQAERALEGYVHEELMREFGQ